MNKLFAYGLFAFLAVAFLLNSVTAYAEGSGTAENAGTGSISELSFYPEKPMISKNVSINFAVKNTGNARQTFKIKILVMKNGNVIKQSDGFLSVYPGQEKGNSSDFYPEESGSYEILAKLYDKYETSLLDMFSMKMDARSEIGPFDLIISPLTRKVLKGDELPVLLTIINKGVSGTDADINLSIRCQNYSISDGFAVFAPPDRQVDKILTMPVCNEDGARNIESSLTIGGRIYAISTAQFYVNETISTMDMRLPNDFLIEQGGTKLLDISVRNMAPYALHNARLFSEGIPSDWLFIQPDSIPEIKQNETAIFLLTVNVPKNAEARTYSARFIASSDELSNRMASVLKVMQADVIPAPAALSAEDFFGKYFYILAVSMLLFLAVKLKVKKRRGNSLSVLRPIVGR